MKRIVFICAIVTIVSASGAVAFDGARKGFVLGGGVGFAPLIRMTGGTGDSNDLGFGLHVLLGYAWDERNMLVLEGNGASFSQSGYRFTQSASTASWYHYFGSSGHSLFSVVGLGLYYMDVEDIDYFDPGGGGLLGIGYEFARHVSVTAYLSRGTTEYTLPGEAPIDHTHTNISVLVSAIAF